jgi:hypothetical protein
VTEPAAQPVKRGRSLVGFYIALGVVAALFGVGTCLWTPLRIRLLERDVREACAPHQSYTRIKDPVRWTKAAKQLVGMGPAAYPALDRLLQDGSLPGRDLIIGTIEEDRATWALPLLVRAAWDSNDRLSGEALLAAGTLSGQAFVDRERLRPPSGMGPSYWDYSSLLPEGRARLLSWWESEGQAKYGEGGK